MYSSVPRIAPPSTRPCPSMCLVAEYTTTSAPKLERPGEHGGGEDVVDDDRGAGRVREPADRRDVDEVLHRVGRRLEEHDVGGRGQRVLPLVELVPVDVVGAHAPLGQDLLEDHDGGPEQRPRGHDAGAGLHQGGDRGEHRGHARRGGEGRLGALEQAQALLERGHRGVAVAGVQEPVGVAGERGLGVGGAGVDEALREEQCLGGLLELAADQPAAHREGVGAQVGARRCGGRPSRSDRGRARRSRLPPGQAGGAPAGVPAVAVGTDVTLEALEHVVRRAEACGGRRLGGRDRSHDRSGRGTRRADRLRRPPRRAA